MVKAGRPSKYTQELADKLCEQLALGKSMRTVCAREDMPSMQTVFSWLRDESKKGFLEQYTRAKEEAADALVDEMLAIADIENESDTNRARLRVDTRKWIASKLKPKRYGEKLDLTSGGEKIIPILGGGSVQSDTSDAQDTETN